jgi:hypothetical protein
MNRSHLAGLLILLTISWGAPGPASAARHHHKRAKKVTAEHQLNALAKRIDKDSLILTRADHIDLLADQFHVPLSVIEDMRHQGQKWGNITIQLAMAESLSGRDPVHYATTADALSQIQTTHHEKKNWSRTASANGLHLKPILAMTVQSYKGIQANGRTERASI